MQLMIFLEVLFVRGSRYAEGLPTLLPVLADILNSRLSAPPSVSVFHALFDDESKPTLVPPQAKDHRKAERSSHGTDVRKMAVQALTPPCIVQSCSHILSTYVPDDSRKDVHGMVT